MWIFTPCNVYVLFVFRFMLITVGATLAWLGVGVAFGLYYEKYDLYTSVYFSLDAMMLSGTFAPPCIAVTAEGASPNDCTLGTTRAVFMSVYLLIGRSNVSVLQVAIRRKLHKNVAPDGQAFLCVHSYTHIHIFIFIFVFLFAGSPLFILTMGQFFESLVYTAQLSHQREKYSTDFTQEGTLMMYYVY